MIYYSKQDLWLVSLVVATTLLLLLFGGWLVFFSEGGLQQGRELIIAGIITAIAVLLLTYPLYYKILPSKLIVRCGLMRWQVPLNSIVEVSPTRNPLGAPTWSLDRTRIDYEQQSKNNFVLISPTDRTEFMRQLVVTEERLELRGDRVVKINTQENDRL